MFWRTYLTTWRRATTSCHWILGQKAVVILGEMWQLMQVGCGCCDMAPYMGRCWDWKWYDATINERVTYFSEKCCLLLDLGITVGKETIVDFMLLFLYCVT